MTQGRREMPAMTTNARVALAVEVALRAEMGEPCRCHTWVLTLSEE